MRGKEGCFLWLKIFLWDHLRLCGEKRYLIAIGSMEKGSPPPMRGKERLGGSLESVNGITPAYAGKSKYFLKAFPGL